MRQSCTITGRLLALLLAVLSFPGSQVLAQASETGPVAQPIRVEITIKARQFRPSPVSVPIGRPVVLTFNNEDAELHAFVPKRFLEGVSLHVDGNGAPQFGEKGLERVLIPSGGKEEISFVPTAAGTFEYRCDLPGHQMIGTIVVEEQPAVQQAGREADIHTQGHP